MNDLWKLLKVFQFTMLHHVYVDITGDLIAGILLSRLVYWFRPGTHGTKLRVRKDGSFWLVKRRLDWWDECRLTDMQVRRVRITLEKLGLVETRVYRFSNTPTTHWKLNEEVLYKLLSKELKNSLTMVKTPKSKKAFLTIPEMVKTPKPLTVDYNKD